MKRSLHLADTIQQRRQRRGGGRGAAMHRVHSLRGKEGRGARDTDTVQKKRNRQVCALVPGPSAIYAGDTYACIDIRAANCNRIERGPNLQIAPRDFDACGVILPHDSINRQWHSFRVTLLPPPCAGGVGVNAVSFNRLSFDCTRKSDERPRNVRETFVILILAWHCVTRSR